MEHAAGEERGGGFLSSIVWLTVHADGCDVFPYEREMESPTPPLPSRDTDWRNGRAFTVQPRTRPSGRSTVVRPDSSVGQLYVLNVNESATRAVAGSFEAPRRIRILTTSSYPKRGTEIHARADSRIDVGAARNPNDANGGDVVLGEAEVEGDGSVYLEVPARTPLRMETLDESGGVIRAMRRWLWVMPMERRGCIGCHEDRQLTPPNRHVLALRKPPQRIGLTIEERLRDRDDGRQVDEPR